MGLIIISFVQTSRQAYECTGRACGFTSEPPLIYRVSLCFP